MRIRYSVDTGHLNDYTVGTHLIKLANKLDSDMQYTKYGGRDEQPKLNLN